MNGMERAIRKPKAVRKISIRPARAAEIRTSLKISAADRAHAHAAITAVTKAGKAAPAERSASPKASRRAVEKVPLRNPKQSVRKTDGRRSASEQGMKDRGGKVSR